MRTQMPRFIRGVTRFALAVCFVAGVHLSGCARNGTSRLTSKPKDRSQASQRQLAGAPHQRIAKPSSGPELVDLPTENGKPVSVSSLLASAHPDAFLQQQRVETPVESSDSLATALRQRSQQPQPTATLAEKTKQQPRQKADLAAATRPKVKQLPIQDLLADASPKVQQVEHQNGSTRESIQQAAVAPQLEPKAQTQTEEVTELVDLDPARPFPGSDDSKASNSDLDQADALTPQPTEVAESVPTMPTLKIGPTKVSPSKSASTSPKKTASLPMIRPARNRNVATKTSPKTAAKKMVKILPIEDKEQSITAKLRMDQLLAEARTHEKRGELHAAYRSALLAKQVAEKHQITVGLLEQSPTVVAESIAEKIWKTPEPPTSDSKKPEALPKIQPERIPDHDQIFSTSTEEWQWENLNSKEPTQPNTVQHILAEEPSENSDEEATATSEPTGQQEELLQVAAEVASEGTTLLESKTQTPVKQEKETPSNERKQNEDYSPTPQPEQSTDAQKVFGDAPQQEWQSLDDEQSEAQLQLNSRRSVQWKLAILCFAAATTLLIIGLRITDKSANSWAINDGDQGSHSGSLQAA